MSLAGRKIRVGRVVSDRMDKTVVVSVEHRRAHRLYKKSIQVRKRYVAHDPENDARLGDLVRLIESRPISKTKRWRIAEIVERGYLAEIQPDEIAIEAEPPEPDTAPAPVATVSPEAQVDETVAEPAEAQETEPETAGEPEDQAETPAAESEKEASAEVSEEEAPSEAAEDQDAEAEPETTETEEEQPAEEPAPEAEEEPAGETEESADTKAEATESEEPQDGKGEEKA